MQPSPELPHLRAATSAYRALASQRTTLRVCNGYGQYTTYSLADGGALISENSFLSVEHSRFEQNSSAASSLVFVGHIGVLRADNYGAMSVKGGELSLDDVVFSNNQALTIVGAAGLSNLTFSIRRCTFESNSAPQVGCFCR